MGDEQANVLATTTATATPATVVPLRTASNDNRGASLVSPFSGTAAFEAAQRMANALSKSTLVPQQYQNNVSNCLIAMELASRIGVSVLATMQNLHIIQGRPSWAAAFLIATVNASGRFTPLRYEWAGKPGTPSWACRAYAKDVASGDTLTGSWITWEMAGKEGWTKKSGSKWLTMPEQMFAYRAAAFWTRMYCPEISIGFQTTEEVADTHGYAAANGVSSPLPEQLTPAGAKSLEAVLGLQASANEQPVSDSAEGQAELPGVEQKPGEVFNGKYERTMGGKPFASGTVEQRKKYLLALNDTIKDLTDNEPKGFQVLLNQLQPHRDACAAEHEAVCADEASGNG